MSDKILLPHIVTIENRKDMTVSGVIQVIAYDEYRLMLKTDYGRLMIQGKNLMASEISSSQNVLKLSGDIQLLQYQAQKLKSENLLSRLFK
ncbi:MAG: YabP/YqfC family sporulation protein [Oscillospiraceae bacterium]